MKLPETISKNLWVLSFFIISFCHPSLAQIEIGAGTGFQFGGNVDFLEGEIKLNDGQNYMAHLTIESTPWAALELSYSRLNTRARFRPYPFYVDRFPGFTTDRGLVEYYQVGGMKILNTRNDRIKPFGLLSLGATRFKFYDVVDSDGTDYGDTESKWRFSVALGGGLKVMLAEKFGIRLQGRLLMPMEFSGVGGYLGIGTGGPYSGISLNTFVAPLQGDFSGGVFFRLGD